MFGSGHSFVIIGSTKYPESPVYPTTFDANCTHRLIGLFTSPVGQRVWKAGVAIEAGPPGSVG